jgi:WD40 repeat protein
MNRFLTLLALIFSTNTVLAQQKCEAIFGEISSEKIVQDLAGLRVDIENAPDGLVAAVLNKAYTQKLQAATTLGIDLSQLTELIQQKRNGNTQAAAEEAVRHEQTIKRENKALGVYVRGKKVSKPSIHGITHLTPHPNQDFALMGYENKTVLINLKTGRKGRTFEGIAGAFSSDGGLVATYSYNNLSGVKDPHVNVIDIKTGRAYTKLIPPDTYIPNLQFSPDGKFLIGNYASGTAFVWENVAGKVNSKPLNKNFSGSRKNIEFMPDGQHVLMLENDAAVLREFPSGKQIKRIPIKKPGPAMNSVRTMQLSPDGLKFFASFATRDVHVISVTTGQILFTLDEFQRAPSNIQFSPDGRFLLTISDNGDKDIAKLFDANSGVKLNEFPGIGSTQGSFNFDGSKLLLTDSNGNLQMWTQEDEEP